MSEGHMERLNAALEGRYHVERELGEGGMATVYLADDLRHERKVALKVLKPELAAVVGAERFLAEIKTTANLQHPHILPLHDSGEADGFLFYVMPYVEGESLRDRLDREKQLPVEEAVRIATDVAEALHAAHAQGVIHRDIKPANILLSSGRPLVADFGIALAVSQAGGGRLTETGLSMGTPHYMSPEQATGDQHVGPTADVYALGCVLYEMLVGEPPYTGSTAQAILGKIIAGDLATARTHRTSVPANVDAAIRRSLEKLPADRFSGAQDFANALADAGFVHGEGAGAPRKARGAWNRLTVATTALAVLFACVAGWSLRAGSSDPDQAVRRFALEVPDGSRVGVNVREPIAFTPDGESIIVNLRSSDGTQQLYMRALETLDLVPIRGTDAVGSFFVSPDGEWLGVHDARNERMIRIPVAGGPTATVVPTPGSSNQWRGASWGDAGAIAYAAADYRGLMRVPASGGEADVLTVPVDGDFQDFHQNPRFLPGGRTALFEIYREDNTPTRIAALSVETGDFDVLTEGSEPDFVSGGFLLFRRQNALWAAAFDPDDRELESEAVPVLEGVRTGGRMFAVSADGTLVYSEGSLEEAEAGFRLIVVDLDGNEENLLLGPRDLITASWSPDGQSVVYSSDGQLYTYDVVRNTTPRQLTFEGVNFNPVYSPDGTRVVFNSARAGTDGQDLFVKELNDDSPPRPILTLEANQLVTQWPSDSLIVFERGEVNNRDLWTVDLSDPENPRAEAYLSSEADLRYMVVSPDGTLAAYRSDESGSDEIYIRSFPEAGAPTLVSEGGASEAFWSPEGSTLYYATFPGIFTAARIERGPVPVVVSRETLFNVSGITRPFQGPGLHPDGDRFILIRALAQDASGTDRLILVQNFDEELRRLVAPN